MPDFLPRRDAELLNWARVFDQRISISPQDLGLTPQQAADYHVAYESYRAMFQLAKGPSTDTSSITTAKDAARDSLIEMIRLLAGIVRACPQVSNTQRVELGLRPRKSTRTPIAKPNTAPGVQVLNVRGSRLLIRLYDPQSPTRIAKPKAAIGALVFVHLGDAPPFDPRQWRRCINASRARFQINLGSSAQPGQKVWIAAQWRNPREMTGPMSTWTSTHVQFGGIEFASGMKMAA